MTNYKYDVILLRKEYHGF